MSPDPDEAQALLRAALAGDQRSLRRFIAWLTPIVQLRVGAVVLSTRAGRRTDVKQDIEDLTQEVFLRLFQQSGRILRMWRPDRGASLPYFLGFVAQRQAMAARRRGAGPTLSDDLGEVSELPSSEPAPEWRLASRQAIERLLARLEARLSPLGIEMFYRVIVNEEEVDEICAATGLTANAIYVWRSKLINLANRIHAEMVGSDSLEVSP